MRTMIDIDEKLMTEAKRIFGTKTKRATVERALVEAIDHKKRLDYVGMQRTNPDWKPGRYEKLMSRAWR